MVDSVTHLVCAKNYTEEELIMNLDLYNVKAVTEQWVLHCVQLRRLAETKAFDPSAPRLLRMVCAALINLSAMDKHRLFAILTFHGARVTKFFGPNNTHLITGLPKGNAYIRSLSHTLHCQISIVSPDWVIDSINQNRLMPVGSYNPRFLLKSDKNVNCILNKASNKINNCVNVSSTGHISSPPHNIGDIDHSLSSILGFEESALNDKCKLNMDYCESQINDPKAAETIANIKTQLQASVPTNAIDKSKSLIKSENGTSNDNKSEIDGAEETECKNIIIPQQVLFIRPRHIQQQIIQQPQHNLSSTSQQIIFQQKVVPSNPNSISNNMQQKDIRNNETVLSNDAQKHPQKTNHILTQTHNPSTCLSQNLCQKQLFEISPNSTTNNIVVVSQDKRMASLTESTMSNQLSRLTSQQQLQNDSSTSQIATSQQVLSPITEIKSVTVLSHNQPTSSMPTKLMQQHLLRQPHILQQHQSSKNVSSTQISFQRHLHQQQAIQLPARTQNNQLPVVSRISSPLTGNMMPPQSSCQLNSPPSQMTPPPSTQSSQHHQGALSVQQHLRQQIHQGRQNRSSQQDIPNQNSVTTSSPHGYQQCVQQQRLHKSQSLSPQQSPTHTLITKQCVPTQKPIDPTDPVQVAQVLSRSTMSPNHESLIMRQQQLKQQQAALQQNSSPHETSSHTHIPLSLQSPTAVKTVQNPATNQSCQRQVINTTSVQGQQAMQNHIFNYQQQPNVQQKSSVVITSPTNVSTQMQNSLALGGQVRIIQQTVQPQNQQAILQQNHVLKNQKQSGNEVNFQQSDQNFSQSSQLHNQEQQTQPPHIQQLTNKPRFIISQQQFNQLNVQQQQQILQQNQHNQNIFIVNQANVNTQQQLLSQSMQNMPSQQTVAPSPNLKPISNHQSPKYIQSQPHTESSVSPNHVQNQHTQQQVVAQSQIILSSQQRIQVQNSLSPQQHQQGISSPQRLQLQSQQVQKQQQNTSTILAATTQQTQQPIVIQSLNNSQQSNSANNNNIALKQGPIIVQQQKHPSLYLQQHSNNVQPQLQQITIISNQQQAQSLQPQQPAATMKSQSNLQQTTDIHSQSDQLQWQQNQPILINNQTVQMQQKPHHTQQFIRTLRPGGVTNQWQQHIFPTNGQSAQPQRQLIQLDDKTHAHFMSLDPVKKAEYIAKLHQSKQRVMLRQQIAFQARPGTPNVVANSFGTGPRPAGGSTQHIIVQSQMPAGLSQQQQMQWLQQQGTRQFVVRSAATPGLTPIQQQQSQHQTQTQNFNCNDPSQQILLQRQQLRVQQIQLQQQNNITSQQPSAVPVVAGSIERSSPQLPHSSCADINMQSVVHSSVAETQMQDSPTALPQPSQQQQMNLKTKTALANMLSNRLGNSGTASLQVQQTHVTTENNTESILEQPTHLIISDHASNQHSSVPSENVNSTQSQNVEPSAAGTLRMMTQQHNAAIKHTAGSVTSALVHNSVGAGTSVLRNQQDLLLLQQQQLRRSNSQPSPYQNQQQQAKLSANASGNQAQMSVATSAMQMSSSGSFLPNRTTNLQLSLRPQYYGHNPNLKLPQELFLVGCTFHVVEYQESDPDDLTLWLNKVRQYGGDIEKSYGPKVTHVLCRTQRHGVVMQGLRDLKRCITIYWLNDICSKRQLLPPWQPLHLPFPSQFGNQKPLEKYLVTAEGFDVQECQRLRQMVEECGGIYTSYLSKINTLLISKNLEGEKLNVAKEWNIPIVNALWLNDICVGNFSQIHQYDCQKYQQYNFCTIFRIDYSLVPQLLAAWKSPINLTQEAHERVKRALLETPDDPIVKRQRLTFISEEIPDNIVCVENPSKKPRIFFSQVINAEILKNMVSILGGEVVDDPAKATHLVMTRESRTSKLVQAVCYVNFVVKSSWIVESAKQGKFLPVERFCIKYIAVDENIKFDLSPVISSSNRSTLFEGTTFYVTPDVFPAHTDIVRMINAAGGKVENKRRTNLIIDAIIDDLTTYIIVTCPNDMFLLVDLTRYGFPNCPIVSTEFIMSSILTQNVDVESHIIPYLYSNKLDIKPITNK